MKLICLFGQRVGDHGEEFAPELLLAWDSYCVEDNYVGWSEALQKTKSELPAEDWQALRIIEVLVDEDEIRRMLVGPARMRGKVVCGP